uniref:C-3 sterol dehydrogenase/C-4 decarboxylase n=1 Tax=Endocarpon pusillum TaxID=364733 RepID=F8QWY9_9EURO|nr:C-3 sterol dehydrogenase/C-4 decarboxylase [Endocarpon pusillum]
MAPDSSAPIVLGRVLIVGGCGFLGYHVVDQFLNFASEEDLPLPKPATSTRTSKPDAASFEFPTLRSRYPLYAKTEVHVLDLRCNRNRLPGATYHEGDLCDPASLLPVFREVKPQVVINTASPTYDAPREILRKVNIEGTKTLLEVAGGAHGDWGGKCKAFVHTSSSSVVHDCLNDLINADERWPLVRPHPVEYYTESKADAEEIVLEANKKHNDMLTCAIRPAGIVGERDRAGMTDALLQTAAHAPDWQLHFQFGEGNNLFDCTYVGNVAYGLAVAAEALLHTSARIAAGEAVPLDHEKVDGEAFIVTNDSPAYFWDIARYVWTLYGRTVSMSKVWQLSKGFLLLVGALAEMSTYITGKKTKMTRQSIRYTPLAGLEEGLARAVKSFVLSERAEKEALGGEKKVQ